MKAKAHFNAVAAALALATGVSGKAWGYHAEVFFAEPHSGEKVTQYEVSLPVSRDATRTFVIPDQCTDAMEALSAGASRWCSRLEKRLWQKVASDCDYYAFLHRYVPAEINDAVSGVDFRNLAIADLMLSFDCTEEGECAFRSPPVPDITPLLGFVESSEDLSGFDAGSCRLVNGSFRGYVVAGAQGLRCKPDPRAPGIRLLSVDYADVNGDGWLDAVLRVVPIGPGANRMPLVLPYTRFGEDEPLGLPAESSPPSVEAQETAVR